VVARDRKWGIIRLIQSNCARDRACLRFQAIPKPFGLEAATQSPFFRCPHLRCSLNKCFGLYCGWVWRCQGTAIMAGSVPHTIETWREPP